LTHALPAVWGSAKRCCRSIFVVWDIFCLTSSTILMAFSGSVLTPSLPILLPWTTASAGSPHGLRVLGLYLIPSNAVIISRGLTVPFWLEYSERLLYSTTAIQHNPSAGSANKVLLCHYATHLRFVLPAFGWLPAGFGCLVRLHSTVRLRYSIWRDLPACG